MISSPASLPAPTAIEPATTPIGDISNTNLPGVSFQTPTSHVLPPANFIKSAAIGSLFIALRGE